jgi:uncharacterized membrane protein HdeD (DUF308 family)
MARHRIGMLLLGIYLILVGLILLFNLHFVYIAQIQGLLALLAGILILASR